MKKFNVYLYLENGTVEVVAVTSNILSNLEARLQKIMWLKCEEHDMYFNMSKVLKFEINEVEE